MTFVGYRSLKVLLIRALLFTLQAFTIRDENEYLTDAGTMLEVLGLEAATYAKYWIT